MKTTKLITVKKLSILIVLMAIFSTSQKVFAMENRINVAANSDEDCTTSCEVSEKYIKSAPLPAKMENRINVAANSDEDCTTPCEVSEKYIRNAPLPAKIEESLDEILEIKSEKGYYRKILKKVIGYFVLSKVQPILEEHYENCKIYIGENFNIGKKIRNTIKIIKFQITENIINKILEERTTKNLLETKLFQYSTNAIEYHLKKELNEIILIYEEEILNKFTNIINSERRRRKILKAGEKIDRVMEEEEEEEDDDNDDDDIARRREMQALKNRLAIRAMEFEDEKGKGINIKEKEKEKYMEDLEKFLNEKLNDVISYYIMEDYSTFNSFEENVKNIIKGIVGLSLRIEPKIKRKIEEVLLNYQKDKLQKSTEDADTI